MLDNALILIAEDQVFIALELAMAVEDAGGVVAGPAASVQSALELIDAMPIVAGILDFNLTDGDVTPVAAALLERNIPFIIQTGIGLPPEITARFPDLVVRMKPNHSEDLIRDLNELIAAKCEGTRQLVSD